MSLEKIKNKIIQGDALEELKNLPDESIDMVVTSPPYLNLKDYANWDSYKDYLKDVELWVQELERILKPGRHLIWNVQDNIPDPQNGHRHYYPLMPDTVKTAIEKGFEWETNIIWNKNNATQVMLGSYPYPPTMIYLQINESICVFRKPGKPDLSNKKKKDKLSKDEWSSSIRNIWNIQPRTSSEHPAPFPIEIPRRVIKMHSFSGDLVLDPFIGSGTTAIAAEELGRDYLGIELNQDYIEIAQDRLAQQKLI